MKLWLDEGLLRKIGFDEPMIRTLRKLTEFVEAQEAIAAAQAALVEANADINDNAEDINTVNNTITTLTANDVALDGRLDTLEAGAPYVSQDQAAAPSYSAYAGQTIAGPTIGEVQATDDAVKAASIALAGVISALQAADVLT